MSHQTNFPRWIPLLGGLLSSTTCGMIMYAFSVFINPFMGKFHWTLTEITITFALMSAMTGLVTFPAGRLSDKFGTRAVVLFGGCLMAFGFFMVSTLRPPADAQMEFLKSRQAVSAAQAESVVEFLRCKPLSNQEGANALTRFLRENSLAAESELQAVAAFLKQNIELAASGQKKFDDEEFIRFLADNSMETVTATVVLGQFLKKNPITTSAGEKELANFFEERRISIDVAELADTSRKASKKALYFLYLFYGILCGLGGGLVYLPPVATAPKWWPDRRAMATGFTVVGLGLGSLIMGPVATKVINSGHDVLLVFKYGGLVIAFLIVSAVLSLKAPPLGYKPAGWEPAVPLAGGGAKAYRDYTYEETRRTSQFWLLWVAYFCGAFAGLMVIGLIAKHGIDAMTLAYKAKAGLDAATAALPDAMIKSISAKAAFATSAFAVTNALVRITIGPILDKFGTRQIFIGFVGCQVVAMLLLFPAGSSGALLAVMAAVVGWNYGALFTLFPSTLMNYFGASSQASNYGLLFTAWGVAGVLGPYVGGKLQEMYGSFFVPFVVSAIVLVLALVILVTVKAPEKKLA